MAVHLCPYHARESQAIRSITVTPTRFEQTFRVGDLIRFGFQASHDCHVTLFELGTSGRPAVLLPNAWRRVSWVESGRPHFLPGFDFPEFDFRLDNPPGTEQVLAVASRAPLPFPALLLPAGGEAFHMLSDKECGQIADGLSTLGPEQWVSASCRFTVLPGGPAP
jgi:hypothetical protein